MFKEQKTLYEYWLSKKTLEGIPARKDIHPKDFLHLLPMVSLIDVNSHSVDEGLRYRIRLAGTNLFRFYQTEITGLNFGEIPFGNKKKYWYQAYNWIVEHGLPATGVVKFNQLEESQYIQFWIRLPLASNYKAVDMILCYDVFLSIEEAVMKIRNSNIKQQA